VAETTAPQPPAKSPRRRLSARKRLAFAALAVAIGLGATEGVLRLAGYPTGLVRSFGKLWNRDPETLADLPGLFRPGFEGRVGYPPELAYEVSFNALGLRGPPLDPDRTRPRVLALGDSVTFGYHVADAETYPVRLEALMAEVGRPVEVVNGGCGHFTITDERRYLEERLVQLDPEVVVLQFCGNDVLPFELDREPTYYEQVVDGADGVDWLRGTALGEAQLRLAIALKRWRKGPPECLAPPVPDVSEAAWARYAAELAELKRVLDRRGVPLVLTAFCDYVVVAADGPSAYDERLSAIAAELDVPFRSALAAFRAVEDPAELYLLPLDPHPSPAGNAALAEVVRDLLLESGVVPELE